MIHLWWGFEVVREREKEHWEIYAFLELNNLTPMGCGEQQYESMTRWRKGVQVASTFSLLTTSLAWIPLLVKTDRARVRTNCSRWQDSVILSCPLTSEILICQTFGWMRTTMNLLMRMRGDGGCIYFFPDWLFTCQGYHSDWIGQSWWGRNGKSRTPGFPGPQIPSLSLVNNFCISCSIYSCCLP